ncbi:MAG: S9 family peptidase [Nitrosomonas sp.]|nr:S9 family peptidase [Nitrosomonas sp.]
MLTIDDVLQLETFDDFFGSQFDVDPSGKMLAISVHRGTDTANRYGVPFLAGGERGCLHLIDLKTGALRQIDAPKGVGLFSPLWSPDGLLIAVAATDGAFVRPCIVEVASGELRVLTDRNLALPAQKHPFHWLSNGELACELLPEGEFPLLLDAEYRGATKAMAAWSRAWKGEGATPSVLASDHPVEAEPDGELCAIDLPKGKIRAYPDAKGAPEALRAFSQRDKIELLQPPSLDDRLPVFSEKVASHPATEQEFYLSRDDVGTRVLRVRSSDVTTIFETDRHLANVAPGKILTLAFEMQTGRTAFMRCILPPDHKEGECRPAIMWVYPGAEMGEKLTAKHRLNHATFFNLQILAAQGYVVLIPAIPLDEEARADREVIDCLADAVLPALDAADEAGLIDRDRVQVMGQSFGGWAVLALLAETTVFRSGIAMASLSNLIGFHGQFDVRFRYDDRQSEYLTYSQMCERLWHFPGPPWVYLERYVRNSPVFAVQKISAPLLLFHGDQDYVPIAQSEEMFSALRRAGKKTEFVRYWGEGHVLTSPANIQDAWSRIFDWLSRNS